MVLVYADLYGLMCVKIPPLQDGETDFEYETQAGWQDLYESQQEQVGVGHHACNNSRKSNNRVFKKRCLKDR